MWIFISFGGLSPPQDQPLRDTGELCCYLVCVVKLSVSLIFAADDSEAAGAAGDAFPPVPGRRQEYLWRSLICGFPRVHSQRDQPAAQLRQLK